MRGHCRLVEGLVAVLHSEVLQVLKERVLGKKLCAPEVITMLKPRLNLPLRVRFVGEATAFFNFKSIFYNLAAIK